jgi:Arabinose-binding domain of AraC transcription regulator, N-term
MASRKARLDTLPSATGSIARLVTARLREAKIPPKPLLTQVGLTLAQIDNSETRVSVQSQIRLLELAADALDDDLLGFRLARDCELRQLGLIYYVLASSETLAESLANAARYSGIANRAWPSAFATATPPRSACAM